MQGDEAVLAIIDGVIEADEATLSTLEELATVAADANDPVTEQIAVDLLAETQQHLRVFRDARTEYAPPPH
jgi:bacterioferritin